MILLYWGVTPLACNLFSGVPPFFDRPGVLHPASRIYAFSKEGTQSARRRPALLNCMAGVRNRATCGDVPGVAAGPVCAGGQAILLLISPIFSIQSFTVSPALRNS